MSDRGLEVVYDESLMTEIRKLAQGEGGVVHTDPTGRIVARSEPQKDRELDRRTIPVPRMGFGRGR
jgi:hypothetical protein